VGRKSIHGGVIALGSDRIQFDFEFDGVRYRPTLKRSPTEANLKRALQFQILVLQFPL
jgi:integrase